MREVEGHPYSIIQWHCWKGRRALQKCFNVKWENLAWIIKECSFDQFCNIVWKYITLKNWNLNGKISLLLYPPLVWYISTFFHNDWNQFFHWNETFTLLFYPKCNQSVPVCKQKLRLQLAVSLESHLSCHVWTIVLTGFQGFIEVAL